MYSVIMVLLGVFGAVAYYINRNKSKKIKNSLFICTLLGIVIVQADYIKNYKQLCNIDYNTELRMYECIDSDIDNKIFTGIGMVDRIIRDEISQEVNRYIDSTDLGINYYKYDIVSISIKMKDDNNIFRGMCIKDLDSLFDVTVNIRDNTGIIEKNKAEFREDIIDSERTSYIDDIALENNGDTKLELFRTGDIINTIIAYDKEKGEGNKLKTYTVLRAEIAQME